MRMNVDLIELLLQLSQSRFQGVGIPFLYVSSQNCVRLQIFLFLGGEHFQCNGRQK